MRTPHPGPQAQAGGSSAPNPEPARTIPRLAPRGFHETRHRSRHGGGLPVVAAATEPVDRGIDVIADRVRRAVGHRHHEVAVGIAGPAPAPAAGWEEALLVVVLEAAEGELSHVVAAGDASCRFAGRLHGRQEQGDENADDGDDDEQFNEREARTTKAERRKHGGKCSLVGPDGRSSYPPAAFMNTRDRIQAAMHSRMKAPMRKQGVHPPPIPKRPIFSPGSRLGASMNHVTADALAVG